MSEIVRNKVPTHDEYSMYSNTWKLVRDSLRGSTVVKSAGERYLPAPSNIKGSGEFNIKTLDGNFNSAYRKFQMLTTFPELTMQGFKGMQGLAFSENSTVMLSDSLKVLESDANGDGDDILTFYQTLLGECLSVGRIGILVSIDGDGQPFYQIYTTENIVDWKYDNSGMIKSVILRENVEEFNEDTFQYDTRLEYLALYVNSNGEYIQKKYNSDFEYIASSEVSFRGKSLDYVPFYVMSPYGMNTELRDSPLTPIANICLQIYRNTAILNKGLATKGDPILFLSGFNQREMDSISVGANNFICTQNINAKVSYAEIDGGGLKLIKEQIDNDIRIAQAYAGKLFDDGGSAQSGESLKQRRLMSEISLSSIVDTLSKQITKLLQTTALILNDSAYLDNQFSGFSDFTAKVSSVDELIKAAGLIPMGIVSRRSVHDLAQRQGITELDFDEEVSEIDKETGL